MKKVIIKVGLILFLICLFAYLFFSDNGLITFLKDPSRIDISWLLMSFICQIINLIIDAYLTHKFLKNIEPKVTIKNSISCSLVGQFFSAITPSASGGQPMQIFVLSRKGISAGTTTSALIQKFIVYQTSIVLYSILAILLRFKYFFSLNKLVYYILVVGFLSQALIVVGLIIFSFNKKLTKKIIELMFTFLGKLKILKNHNEKIENINQQLEIFHSGNKELYKNKYLLLETYTFTFVQLTAMFLIPYCIYRSFYLSGCRVFDMISAQTFVTVSSSFVPIPGGSGAAEGASSIFLAPFFDEKTIKSAIALSRIVSYYFTIVITSPFACAIKSRKKMSD